MNRTSESGKNPRTAPAARQLLTGLLLGTLSLLLMAACTEPPLDEVIAGRAQAHWDALLAGDYEAAYEFLSPGYRSAFTVADYRAEFQSRRVAYTSAQYQSHECEKDVCTVKVKLGYRVQRPAPGLKEWESRSFVEESWIRSDGEWWFLPQQ